MILQQLKPSPYHQVGKRYPGAFVIVLFWRFVVCVAAVKHIEKKSTV